MSNRLDVKVFGLTDVHVCSHLRGHWGMLLCSARLTLNANDITGLEHVDPQGIFTPLTLSQAVSSAKIFFFASLFWTVAPAVREKKKKKKTLRGKLLLASCSVI